MSVILPRLIGVIIFLFQVLGLHFYTLPGQQMCFHQHIAAHVAIAIKYTKITRLMIEGADDGDFGLQCEIRLEARYLDDDGDAATSVHPIIRSLPTSQQSGIVAFSPKIGGEYELCTMCLEEVGRRWKAQLASKAKTKWSLTLDVLDEADLENAMPFGAVDAATGEGLRTTASKVKGLIGKVSGIVSENEYEGDQEETFRNASETVNSRVMWAALLQMVIYAAVAAYQVHSLRTFFRQHKIM